ncbi:MAG: hypothetical protein LBB40_04515, partial [Holophagales bacterium]|nr:hypothetical protein [Holophagales bacterium]
MIADFNSALCECLAFNERLNEEIDRIFRTLKDALGERPIVLYGLTSLVSAEILNFFKERGLQAACICDPQGVSDEFSGVPVIGPQTLKNDFANATVVVCVNYDNDEAECVLAAHGFPRHRIIP